ncbi:uncharacterized protein LOC130989427 isoform X2 [Salvia miltiorrhiza]|nr:uncharacterized protein LOC130989427 isoform X2 [Salvia miltiorrhiza]
MRDGESGRSYGYSSHIDDDELGPKDLRLKLTRKRMSREIELKNEGYKGTELREKVSRASHSDDRLLKAVPYSMRAAETPIMDSLRSSYASWASTGGRARSPQRIPRPSGAIANPSSAMDRMLQVPSARPFDTSQREHVSTSNPLVSSRPNVPMVTGPRRALDSGKLPTELLTAAGSISRAPYQSSYVPKDSQPPTVSDFLHSLGLWKYYINFQAEEVDMAALKQMGEIDLKELGIPMGPRKKILHALHPRPRPASLAHINYLQ